MHSIRVRNNFLAETKECTYHSVLFFLSDASVRPTIIKPANVWSKRHKKTLLSAEETLPLTAAEQSDERQRCFDLLDALTKSGVLSLDAASLHVVIAATHCFDKSLMVTRLSSS